MQCVALLVEQKAQGGKHTGPTLVVCPTSSMPQWKEEIERHTAPGTLSVFTYYGAAKKLCSAEVRF